MSIKTFCLTLLGVLCLFTTSHGEEERIFHLDFMNLKVLVFPALRQRGSRFTLTFTVNEVKRGEDGLDCAWQPKMNTKWRKNAKLIEIIHSSLNLVKKQRNDHDRVFDLYITFMQSLPKYFT